MLPCRSRSLWCRRWWCRAERCPECTRSPRRGRRCSCCPTRHKTRRYPSSRCCTRRCSRRCCSRIPRVPCTPSSTWRGCRASPCPRHDRTWSERPHPRHRRSCCRDRHRPRGCPSSRGCTCRCSRSCWSRSPAARSTRSSTCWGCRGSPSRRPGSRSSRRLRPPRRRSRCCCRRTPRSRRGSNPYTHRCSRCRWSHSQPAANMRPSSRWSRRRCRCRRPARSWCGHRCRWCHRSRHPGCCRSPWSP